MRFVDFNDYRLHAAFWSKVAVKGKSDCWLWLGQLSENGYGIFEFGCERIRAHRAALILGVGISPDVLKNRGCHHCDVKRCCNPVHLFWGSDADNMRDWRDKNPEKMKAFLENAGRYNRTGRPSDKRLGGAACIGTPSGLNP